MHRFPRPSPALFISLLALFFALGGTAFAIGQKSTPQARCQTGAIRALRRRQMNNRLDVDTHVYQLRAPVWGFGEARRDPMFAA